MSHLATTHLTPPGPSLPHQISMSDEYSQAVSRAVFKCVNGVSVTLLSPRLKSVGELKASPSLSGRDSLTVGDSPPSKKTPNVSKVGKRWDKDKRGWRCCLGWRCKGRERRSWMREAAQPSR